MRSRQELVEHIKANPVDTSADPERMRTAFDAMCDREEEKELTEWKGMRGRWYGPLVGDDPIIWLHGGGYVFGSSVTHGVAASTLSGHAKRPVFVADYPLAPEYTYDEILASVSRWLQKMDQPINVIGDSAGGHLALNVARRFPEMVRRLALISPNTDRAQQKIARENNSARDLTNSDADDRALFELAMRGHDPASDDASPANADLSELPPVLVTASTDEVLVEDSLLLIRRLSADGVQVQGDFKPGLFHLWPLWPDVLSEADRTLKEIAAFFDPLQR